MKSHRLQIAGPPPVGLMQDLQQLFPKDNLKCNQMGDKTSFLFMGSAPLSWAAYGEQFIALSDKYKIDFSFSDFPPKLGNPRLMVFDMDSTLIAHEVIDEIGKVAGIGDKIARVTEMAMRGEIDFVKALLDRVVLLSGIPRSELDGIFQRLNLNPGVEAMMEKARHMRIKTAIVSGGFSFFAENLRQKLNMDYALSHELEFENDKLTGRIIGPVIDGQRKKEFMFELAKKHHIAPNEIIAVGDGANDIPMLEAAGMGIAFHAKEKVKRSVSHHVSYGPMTNILHLI